MRENTKKWLKEAGKTAFEIAVIIIMRKMKGRKFWK